MVQYTMLRILKRMRLIWRVEHCNMLALMMVKAVGLRHAVNLFIASMATSFKAHVGLGAVQEVMSAILKVITVVKMLPYVPIVLNDLTENTFILVGNACRGV